MSTIYGELSNIREYIGKVIYPPGSVIQVEYDFNPSQIYGGT